MVTAEKAYWLGDDGDNKSVLIGRKIYTRGQEIPRGGIPTSRFDEWVKLGLISVGEYRQPVFVKDTDGIAARNLKIKQLEADLEVIPALRDEISSLEKSLKTSKGAKKGKELKALEADVKEKAALIEKLTAENAELTEMINLDGAGDGS